VPVEESQTLRACLHSQRPAPSTCARTDHRLPAIWNDPATPARERKRIARLLLTDVTVTRTRDTITAHVRLPAGQHHTLTTPVPPTAAQLRKTPPTAGRG
jgi:hypothetical protein